MCGLHTSTQFHQCKSANHQVSRLLQSDRLRSQSQQSQWHTQYALAQVLQWIGLARASVCLVCQELGQVPQYQRCRIADHIELLVGAHVHFFLAISRQASHIARLARHVSSKFVIDYVTHASLTIRSLCWLTLFVYFQNGTFTTEQIPLSKRY